MSPSHQYLTIHTKFHLCYITLHTSRSVLHSKIWHTKQLTFHQLCKQCLDAFGGASNKFGIFDLACFDEVSCNGILLISMIDICAMYVIWPCGALHMTLRCDAFNSIQQQLNSGEHSVYVDQLKQVNSSNNIIIIVFFSRLIQVYIYLYWMPIYIKREKSSLLCFWFRCEKGNCANGMAVRSGSWKYAINKFINIYCRTSRFKSMLMKQFYYSFCLLQLIGKFIHWMCWENSFH